MHSLLFRHIPNKEKQQHYLLIIQSRSLMKNKKEIFSTLQTLRWKTTLNRFFSSTEHIKNDEDVFHHHQEERFSSKVRRHAILMKGKMCEKREITFALPTWLVQTVESIKNNNNNHNNSAHDILSSSHSHFHPHSHHSHAFAGRPIGHALSFTNNGGAGALLLDAYRSSSPASRKRRTLFTLPFTLSDLAGHGSFLFLALGYMENDFLSLRLYAVFGISLSILFQYYREKPLWIPIRWNTLFLIINTVMIILLLKDQQDANNIPEEQMLLYKNVFEKRGMKPVDFLHLISSAKRIEFKKHTKVVDETKKNNRVYLVKKGKLSILKNNLKVGSIHEHQFVGSMSFLTWEGHLENNTTQPIDNKDDHHNHHNKKNSSGGNGAIEGGGSDLGPITSLLLDLVPVESTPVVMSTSPIRAENEEILSNSMTSSSEVEEALLFSSSRNALSSSSASSSHRDDLHDRTFLDYTISWWKHIWDQDNSGSNNTVSNNLLLPAPIVIDRADDSPLMNSNTAAPTAAPGSPRSNNNGNNGEDGYLGRADVVADEDCIVFSWKFKDLHNLIMENPRLGLVFERCLSEDLNNKMSRSWDEEIKARYKQILLGALMDGEINDKEKQALAKFRKDFHIAADDHEQILREFDWSKEEYDCGYKGGPSPRVIKEYTILLKQELNNPSGLSEQGRKKLREYRMMNDINSELHLNLLENIGWTLDDYEIGMKTVRIVSLPVDKPMKSGSSEEASRTPILDMFKKKPVYNWIQNNLSNSRNYYFSSSSSSSSSTTAAVAAAAVATDAVGSVSAPSTLEEDEEEEEDSNREPMDHP